MLEALGSDEKINEVRQQMRRFFYEISKENQFVQRVVFAQLDSEDVTNIIHLYLEDPQIKEKRLPKQFVHQITNYLIYYQISDIELWRLLLSPKTADYLLLRYHFVTHHKTDNFIVECLKLSLKLSSEEMEVAKQPYDPSEMQYNENIRKNFASMIGYIKQELDFDIDSVVDDQEQKEAII